MQRLRLLPKFILVCLVFLLPLILVSARLMAELEKSIDASEQELVGLSYLTRLQEITGLSQQLRGEQHLHLSTHAAGTAAALGAAIDTRIKALDAFQRQAPGLQQLPAWSAVQRDWQALNAAQSGLNAHDSFARHLALIEHLASLRTQVAERSRLVLDTEMASATLIALAVQDVPELSEQLTEIGARGAAYIDTGLFEANEDQLVNATTLIARHGLERTPLRLARLFEQEPALKPSLQAQMDAFASALAFLERTHSEVGNAYNQSSGRQFLAAANASAARLAALGDAASSATGALLQARAARDRLHRNGMLMAILAALALAAWLFVGFYASFSRDVQRLRRAVRRAAGGDLTLHIDSHAGDEIGDLVNGFGAMTGKLVSLVTDIRTSAATIGSATDRIADGNAALSHHTDTQLQALGATLSSMDALRATLAHSAGHAAEGRQLAASASAVAEHGGLAVEQVVATMASIRASSHKIVDIVGVINGIAFQTNILALNAAVEAARAGAQGRGFAVVAGEVRNLAQRSAAAALEIKALIGDSVATVDAGSAMTAAAGATIGQLVQSVRQVEAVIGAIDADGRQQSGELRVLAQAIARIGEMTQQNRALVEAANAGSAHLHGESGSLARAVSRFQLDQAALPRLTA